MPDDLDNPNAQRRFYEKTDYVFKHHDSSILWNNYGIRFDVVVHSHSISVFFYLR